MQITRRLEFDAGHRIPDHKSQCRHLHGHRYALEITLSGDIIGKEGDAANGMVMDFSEVKAIAKQHVVDLWDHAFLVWGCCGARLLRSLPDHRTVVPRLHPDRRESRGGRLFHSRADVPRHLWQPSRLERVRLYETPNCWADATRPQS